jgi:NAD+ synthase
MNTKKVSNHITNWLKDFALNTKQNGYVIGVSGGIDSAVVSTLCARTGLPLIVVSMPIHQEANQVSRAQEHMDWLKKNYPNVTQFEFDLTSVYDSFVTKLDGKTHFISKPEHDTQVADKMFLTLANTRSRLRMTTLYSLAGLNNMLVAGTGNKVEDFGVGFFTKYGDGGIDVSPIGELMKSEVYILGAELGINQAILSARPTDGLWDDGRTDEDQIGATYDELEWAMGVQEELGNNPETLYEMNERQTIVWNIYLSRHTANSHKMQMPPVCSLKGIKYDEEVVAQ